MRQSRVAYFLLLPTIVLLAIFNYYPAFSGLYHAFTVWDPGIKSRFVGFNNFVQLARDEFFRVSIQNQLLLLIANILKTLIVPLFVAECIMHLRSTRTQHWFRTAFLLPMIVPGMVGILLWGAIYDPNIGLINNFLQLVHLDSLCRNWLGDFDTALWAIVGLGFPWVGGIAMLIYLAGLMAIPSEIYDATKVDGATVLRRFFHIDLPLVRGQIKLLLILTIIGTLQDFGAIYVLTGGGPGLATHVPALHLFYQAFRFNKFGYAASIGFLLFLVMLTCTILNMKFFKSSVEFEAK
ncbi:MAG: sugar ABC transporter permease [bacterium]|nr:sugar ABC transporter permease [bacterium]